MRGPFSNTANSASSKVRAERATGREKEGRPNYQGKQTSGSQFFPSKASDGDNLAWEGGALKMWEIFGKQIIQRGWALGQLR